MRFLPYVLSLTLIWSCSTKEQTSQPAMTDQRPTKTDPTPPQSATTSSITARQTESRVGNSTWQYSKRVDNEGRTVYKASITSPTLLEFDFPYNGGSLATLTIRKRDTDTHVYIQVSKGQFNRSFQEGRARVRFDGHAPVTYTFSAAENGSANVIFFDSEKALIKQLKTARTMLVDVDFAGQGTRQIEFRTAGLKW